MLFPTSPKRNLTPTETREQKIPNTLASVSLLELQYYFLTKHATSTNVLRTVTFFFPTECTSFLCFLPMLTPHNRIFTVFKKR
jgi:hypothetical protein